MFTIVIINSSYSHSQTHNFAPFGVRKAVLLNLLESSPSLLGLVIAEKRSL